jgi:hypothetical protein
MESEWRGSAHARADVSPLYRAMRASAQASDCDRCHAPLRAVSASDATAAEGVTCDVCHTIAKVEPGRAGGAGFALRLDDNVRYGPLCDAKPHYFHAMGCSPLHQEAAFCAACHDLRLPLPAGGTLSVFPEYGEWRGQESTTNAVRTCQDCHMPGQRAEVAVGSPERLDVRSHRFLIAGALRSRALSGRARVWLSAGRLHIALALTNSGAGHSVPTGLPEHQLRVGVEVVDGAGRVTAHAEHTYGRLLVDAAEREVPFYAAVRQRADTRIRVGETRDDVFELAGATAGRLRVFVSWRALSPTLAAQLGLVAPAEEPMLAAVLLLPLPHRPAGAATVVELRP